MKFNLKNLFGAVGVVSVALALGGCGTTTMSRDELTNNYGKGENIMYLNVTSVTKSLPANLFCEEIKNSSSNVSQASKEYMKINFCGKADSLQYIVGAYLNSPSKGVKFASVIAPKVENIGVDDIIKISALIDDDYKFARPNIYLGLIKKDGAQEPKDCSWEGGKRMTGAFSSGGIVCEGWDWKKQKFAQ